MSKRQFTIYDNGDLGVAWVDMPALIGHEHQASPEDDQALLCVLHGLRAPDWIDNAEGYIDEFGWYLRAPEGNT